MTVCKRLFTIMWFVAALAALAATLFMGISYGAKELTLETVWSAVFHYNEQLTAHQIVHDIRLPRVLGAALTGMAFAIAGAIMQGVTRNPMADTGILGVNAGAAFVVALSFAFMPHLPYGALIVLAFAGAALATVFIMLLGSINSGGLQAMRLTIAGAVMAAILHSLSTGSRSIFS